MKFSAVTTLLYFVASAAAREKRQDTEPEGYDVTEFVAGCSIDEGCKWSFNLTKSPTGPSTACHGISGSESVFPEGGDWQQCESTRFQTIIQRVRWCDSDVNPEPPPPSLVLDLGILDWDAKDLSREAGDYEFPNGDLSENNGVEVYIGSTSFHVKPQRLDIAC